MLNLEPLELRRLRFDLIMYYKIIHNLSGVKESEHFNYYHPVVSSRTVSPKLIKCSKANNVVNYSFLIVLLNVGTVCLMMQDFVKI